ncbi:MAG: hypothetical protein PWQ37_812 [Candidatus Petromonas sp.]|jgi:hypothetical protein|nr:hypothetical protein [Candidatus Petromonas sp.]
MIGKSTIDPIYREEMSAAESISDMEVGKTTLEQ